MIFAYLAVSFIILQWRRFPPQSTQFSAEARGGLVPDEREEKAFNKREKVFNILSHILVVVIPKKHFKHIGNSYVTAQFNREFG